MEGRPREGIYWVMGVIIQGEEGYLVFGIPEDLEGDWILEALARKRSQEKRARLLKKLGLTKGQVERHFREMNQPKSDITPA